MATKVQREFRHCKEKTQLSGSSATDLRRIVEQKSAQISHLEKQLEASSARLSEQRQKYSEQSRQLDRVLRELSQAQRDVTSSNADEAIILEVVTRVAQHMNVSRASDLPSPTAPPS